MSAKTAFFPQFISRELELRGSCLVAVIPSHFSAYEVLDPRPSQTILFHLQHQLRLGGSLTQKNKHALLEDNFSQSWTGDRRHLFPRSLKEPTWECKIKICGSTLSYGTGILHDKNGKSDIVKFHNFPCFLQAPAPRIM